MTLERYFLVQISSKFLKIYQKMEEQPQRRVSQRQRRNPQRLEIGEGVRAGQGLPWMRRQRVRVEAVARNARRRVQGREAHLDAARGNPQAPVQLPPAAPEPAPPAPAAPQVPPAAPADDERPELEIIEDHRRYARKDKASNSLTFFTKMNSRLCTALLALYQGAPSEISKFYMEDPYFIQFISELNDYHSLNFPCNQPSISVLSVYTSDLLKELQDPFLFQFTVFPSAFSISQFLRDFFKNSLISDQFLLKLAIFCMPEAATLKEDFVVGVVRCIIADAEAEAVRAHYFCKKCFATFQEESQLLSHTGKNHNWALAVNMTEGNSAAAKNRLFLVNMAQWTTAAPHRALVCDTNGANAHFARYREVEIQGIVNGQPHGSKALLSSLRSGFVFDGQFTPNLDSDSE